MTSPTPLTAHLFAELSRGDGTPSRQDVESLVVRLRQDEVAVVMYGRTEQPDPSQWSGPQVYVSIGGRDSDFEGLYALPFAQRRRWLHYPGAADVRIEHLFHCWLAATDPPAESVASAEVLTQTPLVSVFTAAYRSRDRIQRPYRSLLAQTYPHWEWVVVDDGSDDDTYERWIVPFSDPRVRKFRRDRHSGYIGTVKRDAVDVSQGEILVEVDHDDELTPDCLQRIVDAFRRHPDCGFAFGENAEVFEGSLESRWYGWDAGFGFLSYWKQLDPVTDRIQSVARTASTNGRTIRHLVGLPNHPRAWTRNAYRRAGGHRRDLSVADDYDLLVRTFLTTRFVRVPHLLYVQYVNADQSNQTIQRNRQIQFLCKRLEAFYRPRIDARLTVLRLPVLTDLPYRRVWTCDERDPRHLAADVVDHAEATRSFLFVLVFGEEPVDTTMLLAMLHECMDAQWRDREVVVVGNVPEGLLLSAARKAPPGSVRWWRTDPGWTPEALRCYGRLQCSGRIIEEVTDPPGMPRVAPTPLRLALLYRESYALTAEEDRSCDRLMVLFDLRQRFAYRHYLEIGTATDEVFAQMNGMLTKVGVDPASGGTHRMTSDAYFAANRALPEGERARFDLVLVDGLHEYAQVLRDVDNALECLLPGGTIVLHDCMPFAERQQVVPRPLPWSAWTGDVWKAIFLLRGRADIDVATGRFDWGVAVLRVRPNSAPFKAPAGPPDRWLWRDYLAHREQGLNAMGYSRLLQWVGEDAPTPVP